MDVHIEELTTDVSVMDDQALLSPAVLARIVEQVLARVRDAERSQGIAQANTQLNRAANRQDRGR